MSRVHKDDDVISVPVSDHYHHGHTNNNEVPYFKKHVTTFTSEEQQQHHCQSTSIDMHDWNDSGTTRDYSYLQSSFINQSIRPTLACLEMRFLCPEDIDIIKSLFNDIFPIDYPDYWYHDVVSNPNLFAVAALFKGEIVGVIVAEVKRMNQCNLEDRTILAKSFPANTPVAYVLSLGVVKSFRKRGVASTLLNHLLAYLTNGIGTPLGIVKALYLHVMASNGEAISFYEKRNFRRHSYLYGYYAIEGEMSDGLSYVRYLNGGEPPWTFSDFVVAASAILLKPCCFFPKLFYRWLRGCTKRLIWYS